MEQDSAYWGRAEEIRKFADCVESRNNEITDIEERKKLSNWLKFARDKADWLDPLIEKKDEILGKRRYLFDSMDNED